MIRELAENANTYTPLAGTEERIVDPRYVIWFGAATHPYATVVQRLRLAADDVDAAVDEIRALIADRNRDACTWEVADSATPADLVTRLRGRGCEPDREPLAVGMVLTEPPRVAAGDPVVRRVETLSDYETAIRIAHDAFGMPATSTEEALAGAPADFEQRTAATATYLAYSEGVPVARATAVFTDHGALLFGGATVERARGRGAYRALVRARWDDAVDRGTPVLVTHAGAMSRPILAALGFREVSRIEILLDRFGESS